MLQKGKKGKKKSFKPACSGNQYSTEIIPKSIWKLIQPAVETRQTYLIDLSLVYAYINIQYKKPTTVLIWSLFLARQMRAIVHNIREVGLKTQHSER